MRCVDFGIHAGIGRVDGEDVKLGRSSVLLVSRLVEAGKLLENVPWSAFNFGLKARSPYLFAKPWAQYRQIDEICHIFNSRGIHPLRNENGLSFFMSSVSLR